MPSLRVTRKILQLLLLQRTIPLNKGNKCCPECHQHCGNNPTHSPALHCNPVKLSHVQVKAGTVTCRVQEHLDIQLFSTTWTVLAVYEASRVMNTHLMVPSVRASLQGGHSHAHHEEQWSSPWGQSMTTQGPATPEPPV